jgi:hypothetical protein
MKHKPVPVVLAVADLHWSHKPPVARCVEEDWYAAMERPWDQVVKLQNELKVPLIIAGDLFDDGWRAGRCPPQLINWVITQLSRITQHKDGDYVGGVFAVPGQHDLPHHRLDGIDKSAFWTLKEAGLLTYLSPGSPLELSANSGGVVRLHGFPWGVPVKPLLKPHDLLLEVAVIHSFVWTKTTGYAGAPDDKRVKKYLPKLKGYDVAIFGDNHIPFTFPPERKGGTLIYNCGGFLRRKIDEITHKPSVGIIHSDGTVKRHYLDCSRDKFLSQEDLGKVAGSIGFESVIEALSELGDGAIDFREAIMRVLRREKVSREVKDLVTKLMGDVSC